MSPDSARLIGHLERRQPARPTELRDCSGIDLKYVHVLLQRLQEDGYVQREPDPMRPHGAVYLLAEHPDVRARRELRQRCREFLRAHGQHTVLDVANALEAKFEDVTAALWDLCHAHEIVRRVVEQDERRVVLYAVR